MALSMAKILTISNFWYPTIQTLIYTVHWTGSGTIRTKISSSWDNSTGTVRTKFQTGLFAQHNWDGSLNI